MQENLLHLKVVCKENYEETGDGQQIKERQIRRVGNKCLDRM